MKRTRTSYQRGSLQLNARRCGPDVWVYRWRERLPDETAARRGVTVGTVEQFPTKAQALRASEHMRVQANSRANTRDAITFRAVINRYKAEEMPNSSTASGYRSILKCHIEPRWANLPIAEVKPMLVRKWLSDLNLANKTKKNIKALMHSLCQCAMLWEWMPVSENPMSLFRARFEDADHTRPAQEKERALTVEQFLGLLSAVEEPAYRLGMVLAVCLGLRCSELGGLQWSDLDWERRKLQIRRTYVGTKQYDRVKAAYSRKPIPLDDSILSALLDWRGRSEFKADGDWVFASPHVAGEKPYKMWGVQHNYIAPAARELKLGEHIGWHTLRHTYRTWLDETGATIGVQQKLMRHGDIRTTMNVYGDALEDSLRTANSKVVSKVKHGLLDICGHAPMSQVVN
jgi:integrase